MNSQVLLHYVTALLEYFNKMGKVAEVRGVANVKLSHIWSPTVHSKPVS